MKILSIKKNNYFLTIFTNLFEKNIYKYIYIKLKNLKLEF